jgi:arylsulfatase
MVGKKIPHTIPFLLTFDETFDVGVDTRTGVDDNDYQVPFRFNGQIAKLTVKLEPPAREGEPLQPTGRPGQPKPTRQ